MNNNSSFLRIFIIFVLGLPFVTHADWKTARDLAYHKDAKPEHFTAGLRNGVTSGYYLGFTSLADEMRDLRRPSNIPVTNNFLKAFYFDVHYSNQEFNWKFFKDDNNASTVHPDDGTHLIENTVFGITLGFSLGDNPNLDVRLPISSSRFKVGNVDDTGMLAGI